MKRLVAKTMIVALITTLIGATFGACGSNVLPDGSDPSNPGGKADNLDDQQLLAPSDQLQTFGSAAEFDQYLQAALKNAPERTWGGPLYSTAEAKSATSTPSITNNQEAGVDEGDIVKAHGKHLVILRRGRLFSVKLGDQSLTPVSVANAYPEGSDLGTWYDEMLIHGDTIVVVGFSYRVGATELGLFSIDASGEISHKDTWFLRSNDYYSSRNYASRLVDGKLVFYMPYSLLRYNWALGGGSYSITLPGIHRFPVPEIPEGSDGWQTIVEKTTIYRPVQPVSMPVLHTIVTCDLGQAQLSCSAQGIIGPYSRNFYVSKDAVYLWVSAGHGTYWPMGDQGNDQSAGAVVYRLPLDGSNPGAVRALGSPTDQFSFKQTDDDSHLNVLVRATASGDGMWSPEVTQGDVGLVRIPLAAFTSMIDPVNVDNYASLIRPGQGYIFQNRFVHDHVLYGTGNGWWDTQSESKLYVYQYKGGGAVAQINLSHSVDRIEVMGRAAVVVGSAGNDLHLTSVELSGYPRLAGLHVEPNAVQGETRSHGFFYLQQGSGTGLLGLPIREKTGSQGWHQLFSGSARVMFLRVHNNQFISIGSLEARPESAVDDHCVVSCVDWYGNARPIFYGGRILGLLGYELVEGNLAESWPEQLIESSRVDMSSLLSE